MHSLFIQFLRVGVNGTEDTPVPIPNTEVKLCNEDDTWLETTWESISMPAQDYAEVLGFRFFIMLIKVHSR